MHARIVELESKLVLLDDQLDKLNLTVFRQQEQIDLLQRQLRLVWQQMQAAPGSETRDVRDEIPPHY